MESNKVVHEHWRDKSVVYRINEIIWSPCPSLLLHEHFDATLAAALKIKAKLASAEKALSRNSTSRGGPSISITGTCDASDVGPDMIKTRARQCLKSLYFSA